MRLEEFVEIAGPLRALGVKVSQDGEQIAEHLWEPVCRRNIYSATKSFTSAAVGIAIGEGLLSLDERLVDVFPDELPEQVSENLEKARVRDLLTMGLGQEKGWLMGVDRPLLRETNWVRLGLSYPFTDAPGSRFVYNNVGPHLAAVLVQRRAGCDLQHYLLPRMLRHMDIMLPTWEVDPEGYAFGAGGLMLSLDELHRFGLLYLQNGRWNGRQIVPEEWVKASTSVQIDNGREGYGYLFWRGEHNSARADGKYGQLSILLPEKDSVITLLAEKPGSPRPLHDMVWQCLYPQL